MTSIPPDDDDIVGQVVEKAAEKAATAAVQVPAGPPVMSRKEAVVAVAVLLIVNVANFWVTVQNRGDVRGTRANQAVICQLLEDVAPPGTLKPSDIAKCLE